MIYRYFTFVNLYLPRAKIRRNEESMNDERTTHRYTIDVANGRGHIYIMNFEHSRMRMNNSIVGIVDLPEEILLTIFNKLNPIDTLYSLLGVNQKLDKVACDIPFTQSLMQCLIVFVLKYSRESIIMWNVLLLKDACCNVCFMLVIISIYASLFWLI